MCVFVHLFIHTSSWCLVACEGAMLFNGVVCAEAAKDAGLLDCWGSRSSSAVVSRLQKQQREQAAQADLRMKLKQQPHTNPCGILAKQVLLLATFATACVRPADA